MGVVLLKRGRIFMVMVLATAMCIGTNGIRAHAYACSKCLSPMAEICNQEKIEYESGYHSYGFLFTKQCYMKAKVSTGKYVCACGEVEVWEDSSGTKLKHLCFEEHSACSKGQYDVCPF